MLIPQIQFCIIISTEGFAVKEGARLNRVVIGEIGPNETAQVKELFETVYVNTFSGHAPAFEETSAGEKIYAARLDGDIVGFASVWEPEKFIHYLFVSPTARRKKVGSTLVNRLVEIYGGPLTLKCLISNENGMAFYRATGWKERKNGISEDGAYALLIYDPSKGEP